MSKRIDLRLPDGVEQLVLDFLTNECQGEDSRTSRAYLACEYFGAPSPKVTNNKVTFPADSFADRLARETIATLQHMGHLIGYSSKGGAFLSKEENDIIPYMNKEWRKYHTLKKKLDAMYHSYKRKYGAEAALKLFDGQGEFNFMDRFDSQGNETIQEPPIENEEE